MSVSPELRDAAPALCRTFGIDPDAVSSSAYDAPPNWEAHIRHAVACQTAWKRGSGSV